MPNLSSQIKKIRDSFKVDKKEALKIGDFKSLKNSYIGRKGKIALLFKQLAEISNKDKKEAGAAGAPRLAGRDFGSLLIGLGERWSDFLQVVSMQHF